MKALSGALLIGLLSAGVAAAQRTPEFISLPGQQTAPMPGGARFPGSFDTTSVNNGASFPGIAPMPAPIIVQNPPATLPPASPTVPGPASPPASPVLPAPQPTDMPAGPMFLPGDSSPPVFDGAVAEPFESSGQLASRFPALGPWGARVESTDGGPHLWLSTDYMFWWIKKGPMPQPLVVTGSLADEFPGALDQANTSILYGAKSIDYNPFSAVRVSLGLWGGRDNRFGFELGGFLLEQKATKYQAFGGPNGEAYIARPFINAQTGFENVYFVSQNFADPDLNAAMTGAIEISNTSRLWSWETNGLLNVWRGATTTANLIGGFRSVGLRERLHIVENLQNLSAGGGVYFARASVDPGSTVATYDYFDTENTFYGGQLGTRLLFQRGRFSLNLTGKAAIGVVQQLVIVDGGTIVRNGIPASDGRGTVTGAAIGGVLAQTSNIGRHFRNTFGVIPEGAADLCIDVTDRLVFKVGYTFMYLNSVARPGNQIDRTINPGLVPTDGEYGAAGPARPAFQFKSSGIWAQGVNIGLEFRY